MSADHPRYDAVIVVSFGGPEGPDDVMPYLNRVLEGRPIPEERKLEVAHHYQMFGGVSPINAQNRALIDALRLEMAGHGIDLPVYFGNRNWHPLLPDALREMADAGVRRALAFVTSAFSCYSGCRQYRENIRDATGEAGEGSPQVDKIRVFYNHPGFIEANAARIREALEQIPSERRDAARIIFSAHSIPQTMAAGSRYEEQLAETCGLVMDVLERDGYDRVYQSRSGPPHQPWLEPDICDFLEGLEPGSVRDVVIAPIGFVSDHMEVLFDLDTEAREVCEKLGIHMVRAASVGTHPAFVSMVRELIAERLSADVPKRSLGQWGPYPDVCPEGCCAYEMPRRPVARPP